LVDTAIYLTFDKVRNFQSYHSLQSYLKVTAIILSHSNSWSRKNGNIAQVSAANYVSARDTKIIREWLNLSCEVTAQRSYVFPTAEENL